jgi:hypothetical protein
MLRGAMKIVLSLALLFASYVLVGWGAFLETWSGVVAVVVGSVAYFCSLSLAESSKIRWVFALIVSLGSILGLIVLFVCLPNGIFGRHERWTSIAVIFVEVAGVIAYFAVRRRYRRQVG